MQGRRCGLLKIAHGTILTKWLGDSGQ